MPLRQTLKTIKVVFLVQAMKVALPLGKNTSTHWIGGWVGPRASLDVLEKIKIPCPYKDLNPGPSSL